MDWSAVATVAVVCLAILGTLWGALMLLTRAIGAVTAMCSDVVRSLLGQDADGDDGVQFEEDKIVMIEFKSAGSQLSTRQRRIRNLVREGKVDFQEIRVD
jgi:hypothetical protein